MKHNWNSQEEAALKKNPLYRGGMDIFWDYTFESVPILRAIWLKKFVKRWINKYRKGS